MHKLVQIISLLVFVSALGLFAGAGCGKSNAGFNSADGKVFDTAPAEIKQAWQDVLAADAGTNYVETLGLLNKLKRMPLSEEQSTVVTKKFSDFDQRLFSAAATNDPSAVQALQVMRTRH